MKIEKFELKLKSARRSWKQTAFYGGVAVVSNTNKTEKKVYKEDTCSKCGHTNTKSVRVVFKKPIQLSLFQSDLLYALYCLNEIPRDYAQYHKCPAGKDFIENIRETKVVL